MLNFESAIIGSHSIKHIKVRNAGGIPAQFEIADAQSEVTTFYGSSTLALE